MRHFIAIWTITSKTITQHIQHHNQIERWAQQIEKEKKKKHEMKRNTILTTKQGNKVMGIKDVSSKFNH